MSEIYSLLLEDLRIAPVANHSARRKGAVVARLDVASVATHRDHKHLVILAIGIGINLASFPEGTEFPAISLLEVGLAQLGLLPPPAEEALTVLAARFAHWYDAWMSDGFDTIRDAWLARAWASLSAPGCPTKPVRVCLKA